MSDVDGLTIPDAATDLVDVDEDDFDSDEAFREWVDGRLAELESTLDAQDARDDAIVRRVDTVREVAERAERRAERAEMMAAWGGLGYGERVEQVLDELVRRARQGDGKAAITTTEQECEDLHGNRYSRPGVVDLFDGGVSDRTARRYIADLGTCRGLIESEGGRGGWGGGSDPKRLKLNLRVFFDAYGADWDVEDVVADMREGDR